MRNSSSSKPSIRDKPRSRLGGLGGMKADGLSNEDLFQNSIQSFDFSAVEWDSSNFTDEQQHASCLASKTTSNDDNQASDSDCSESQASSPASASDSDEDKNGESKRLAATKNDKSLARPPSDEGGTSGRLVKQPLDLDDSAMEFFRDDNVFKVPAATETALQSDISRIPGNADQKASSLGASASQSRKSSTSSLRQSTKAPVNMQQQQTAGHLVGGTGAIKPLERRLEKPVTTRHQRQKSVGSAMLVPGAKLISRQHRQRSMGMQPLSRTSSATGSSAGSELFGDADETAPKVRNPRLARKRQESFRVAPPSGELTCNDSSSEFVAAAAVNDVQREKVVMNTSIRGARSIFQRTRQKVDDEDDDNGNRNAVTDNNKLGGAIGALFKHALATGEGEEQTTSKSPAQLGRLHPRNFFNRNKHAFMDSDEISSHGSSSGSDDASESENGERPPTTEDSVMAIIRAKESAPTTAEDKVLALIRQKEREKGSDEVCSVPSFLSDDDESSELQSMTSSTRMMIAETGNKGSNLLESVTAMHSPQQSSAENKVMAMIKAKERDAPFVDANLRAELLAEDECRNSPGPRSPSAENKVLAMINAKRSETTSVDENLRAELLGEEGQAPNRAENKVLALIKATEKKKELERSKHSHSKAPIPTKPDEDASTHRRRSSKRDDDERKRTVSHRSSHRAAAEGKGRTESKKAIDDNTESSSHRHRSSRRKDDNAKASQSKSRSPAITKEASNDETVRERSTHRRRSVRQEEDGAGKDDKDSHRRSSRSKYRSATDTSKSDKVGQRRSSSHNKHDTPLDAQGDDLEVLAQIKSKVKEGLSGSSHSRRLSEQSPHDALGSTWHPSDKSSRGVNRSLSSSDHRPSKGRVRKIRVSVSDLHRIQGSGGEAIRSALDPARKGSGNTGVATPGNANVRPHHSEGIEARRRRSRSTVGHKSP